MPARKARSADVCRDDVNRGVIGTRPAYGSLDGERNKTRAPTKKLEERFKPMPKDQQKTRKQPRDSSTLRRETGPGDGPHQLVEPGRFLLLNLDGDRMIEISGSSTFH